MFYSEDFVLGDIPIVRHSSEACPVCGERGGNCRGDAQAPVHIVGLSQAKPVQNANFLVTEDVFEEVYITNLTKTKVLVARAGSYITFEKALELGLIDA